MALSSEFVGKDSVSCRFRASIIGLPKRPDTKFRKPEFSGRIRSSISRKCRGMTGPLFPKGSLKIYDPGSPDVSCLGRIKLNQKEGGTKLKGLCATDASVSSHKRQGRFSWIKKLFSFSGRRKSKPTAGSDESCCRNYEGESELKRFDSLSNFSEDDVGKEGLKERSLSLPQLSLWKRRSVSPPMLLELNNRYYAFDMRRPVTV